MQNMENKKNHDIRQDKRNRMLCLKVKENDLKAETMLLMENKGLLLNMIKMLIKDMEVVGGMLFKFLKLTKMVIA